jgi:hypothetical protein
MSAPLFAALLALLSARTCAAFEWKTCGVGSLKVKSVDLTPEPVPPGATAQFSIAAEASAPAAAPRPAQSRAQRATRPGGPGC